MDSGTLKIFKNKIISNSSATWILIYFTFYAINQLLNWPMLAKWGIKGEKKFIDLYAILRNADCYENIGWEIYKKNLENSCNNYIYGSTLIRVLHFFHIGTSNTNLIGWSFILGISIIFGICTAKFTKATGNFILPILIFCSPPIFLLLERGNFDSLIFIGVFLSSYLFKKKKFIMYTTSIFLLSDLKFYPIVLIPISVLIIDKNLKKLIPLIYLSIFAYIALLDLRRAKSIVIGSSLNAFGVATWGDYLKHFGLQISLWASILIGVALLLTTLITVAIVRERNIMVKKYLPLSNVKLTKDSFLQFSTLIVMLGCYFGGLNFDYRLIFLAVTLSPDLFDTNSIWKRRYVSSLYVGTMWLSCNVHARYQGIGEVFLLLLLVELIHSFNLLNFKGTLLNLKKASSSC